MRPFFPFSVRLCLLMHSVAGLLAAAPAFDPANPPSSPAPPTEAYQRHTGTHAHTKGPKTVMFIYVQPVDGNVPVMKTHAQLSAELDSASLEYYRASYHQTWFGPVIHNYNTAGQFTVPRLEVTPLVQLSGTAADYRASFGLLESHATAAVRALGGEYAQGQRLDPANFDRILAFGDPKLINSTGLAFVGGRFSWSGNTLSGGVVIHEWGHNWGLYHANFWQSSDGQPRSATGSHYEYGDGGDIMGGGNTPFNALFRDRLGFLERGRNEVEVLTTSGTRRIFAYTTPAPRHPNALRRALLLPVTGSGTWDKLKIVSFRHAIGTDGGLTRNDWDRNAVQIHSNRTSANSSDNLGSHFLDTTPGSRSGGYTQDRIDGGLKIGRTYSEGPNLNGTHLHGGVHITPVARGSVTLDGTVHEYIDVVVNYGKDVPAGNAPPAASFDQGVYAVAVNTPLTLTVQASDPDGDALAFDWSFGDSRYNIVNSAVQTRSWSTPGFYLVSCGVSDMKGGTATAYAWVNVGAQPYQASVNDTTLAGLNYRYYEGSWSTLPNFDLLMPVDSGTVSGVTLSMRQRNDNFAVLFTGYLEVPEENVYQFRIRHDDGVRLSVAGQTVIHAPGELSSALESIGNIALQPGRHPFRLEYYHRTGSETLNLRVWRAGEGEIPVPESWFSQSDWAGNAAPLVALLSPGMNETFVSNSDVLLQASASDDDGIDRVVFFANGAYLGEAGSPPYEFLWEKVSVGPRELTAIAYDVTGRWTQSAPVSIVVENPPPANGFGISFGVQNDNTRIQYGERAGAVYRYPNWTQITGSVGTDNPVTDHNGFATGARVSHNADGAGSGFFETFGSADSADGRMMRGGLHRRHDIEPQPNPNPHADVAGVPYSSYDVYVYFDYRNDSADDTIPQRLVLTPSEGPAPAPKFGRNSASHTNGLGDFPGYDTFNGFREATATQLQAPDSELFGNYVVFRNQTASSFRVEATRNNPATLGTTNGRHRRYFNAIQVIERVPQGPGLVVRRTGDGTVVSESGQTDLITVALAYPPTGPVTVSLSPDAQLTATPAELSFDAQTWNQAQAVLLGAVNDHLSEGTHAGVLTLTAAGANYAGLDPVTVPVTILDNDFPTVNVTAVRDARNGPNPQTGRFHLERGATAVLTDPLVVHFTLSGSGSFGVGGPGVTHDSGTGAGTLTIPAGQGQGFVDISSIDGSGTFPLTLTVSPRAEYALATANATLTVVDETAKQYFTQHFTGSFPLSFHKVTFTPNGSGNFYSAGLEPVSGFPTSVSGHTNLKGTGLTGGNLDDGFWRVDMPASFYGTAYDRFFVGTNGYVTFGQGDNGFTGDVNKHFQLRRVSGILRDLNPTSQGNIYAGRITTAGQQRSVVTFEEVAVYGNNSVRVNFQIEFWDSGVITLTWLNVHANATNSVAGLSRVTGGTPGDFIPTDFASLGGSADTAFPPKFVTLPPLRASVGQSYSHTAVASDPNGDALVFTAVETPAWLSLAADGPNRAVLSGTPPASGAYEIRLRVSDGALHSDQAYTLWVDPATAPAAPVFTSTPPAFLNTGDVLSHTITATDALGQPLRFVPAQLPGWMTLTDHGNGTATLTGMAPQVDVNNFTVSLLADNGFSAAAQTFVLSVNRPPVITLITPFSPVLSLADTQGILWVQAEVTDDGAPSDPGTVSVQWSVVEGPEGVVFSTPQAPATGIQFASPGEYRLRLTASDGAAASQQDLFVSVGGDPNAALAGGLLGYWRFNESGGTTAADSSGNGLHLSLTGSVAFAAGIEGNAYQGTASDAQYAEALLSQPTQFTFAAWINSTVSPSDRANGRHVFSFRGNNNNRARFFLTDGEGRLRFQSAHSTNGVWVSDSRLTANDWTHVVLSYDQSSLENHPVLFINGEPVGMTRLTAPSGSVNTSEQFRVGGLSNDSTAWKGRIDETRLYERILSDAERAALSPARPVNQAPSVSVALRDPIEAGQNSGVFQGTVSDDGLPDGGTLTLLWTVEDGPEGVEIADPEAAETTVTFPGNGSYTLRLTAHDGELFRHEELSVNIFLEEAAPTRIEITPATAVVSPEASFAFTALVLDQFDQPMAGQVLSWSVSGGGTISSEGLFTAGGVEGGPFTVTASSGALSGEAQVSIFNQPPHISAISDQELAVNSSSQPIDFTVSDAETSADQLVVSAQSSNHTLLPLSGIVLGGSGGGRTVTLTPAQHQSGSVTVTLTVSDGSKQVQTSFLLTVLPPVASSITVSPASVSLYSGESQVFSALVLDQDGQGMDPQPSVSWSVSGGGSISTDGVFTAGESAGTFTVSATSGEAQGTASVTVQLLVNEAPDITLTTPQVGSVNLPGGVGLIVEGHAADDGLPLGSSLSVLWTVDTAPVGASVLFDRTDAVATAMRFDLPGDYLLRVTASDGELTDSVAIHVSYAAAGWNDPLTPTLWYRLDGNALDAAGSNNATVTGAVEWEDGVRGQGVRLDLSGGSTAYEYLQSSSGISLTGTSAFSVSVWFRLEAESGTTGSTTRVILQQTDSGGTGRTWLYAVKDGSQHFLTSFIGGSEEKRGTAAMALHTWHHAALVYNNGSLTQYLNGVPNGSWSTSFETNAGALRLGNHKNLSTAQQWIGGLDEFVYFNRALSAGEIEALAARPGPTAPHVSITAAGEALVNEALPVLGAVQASVPVSTLWQNSAAAFGDPSALSTTVTFAETGAQSLRLRADDGEVTVFAQVEISVSGETPDPYALWAESLPEEEQDPLFVRDGITNLARYALGLHPTDPVTGGLPEIARSPDGAIGLRLTPLPGGVIEGHSYRADGVVYSAQAAHGALPFTDDGWGLEEHFTLEMQDGQLLFLHTPSTEPDLLFLRLRMRLE